MSMGFRNLWLPDSVQRCALHRKRFRSRFHDPAFTSLGDELDRIIAAAWDVYSHSRKAPRTQKAGAGFADPNTISLPIGSWRTRQSWKPSSAMTIRRSSQEYF